MWRGFRTKLRKWAVARFQRRIKRALALECGEMRRDGLALRAACSHLAVTWAARSIHPWDMDESVHEQNARFVQQVLEDTDAAVIRLFDQLPELDVISVKVLDRASARTIIAGMVHRSNIGRDSGSLRMRLMGWGLELHSDGLQFEALDDFF